MSNTIINKVPQCEAETKEDRLLLGFIKQESERLQFGTVVVEFKIRDGKVYGMESHQQSRTFLVGSNT